VTLAIVPSATPITEQWRSLLRYKDKEITSNAYNARILFEFHDDYKGFLRWNQLMLCVEVTGGPLTGCSNPDDFEDVITWAQDHLYSKHELTIPREEVGRRLVSVALKNKYDPLKEYLDSLVWDGIPRLETMLITYGGAEDSTDRYARIVSKKWMVSGVARAYQAGCKADVVLVAEGAQGAHKSTMLRILGGEWYCEASGVLGDKDSKQLIGAAWICELPDMASFSKSDRNAMKAFFSSPVDKYRPPYGKVTISVPRRSVFAATTNDEEYLTDPTGHRRFWPVMLGEIDRAAMIRDKDQLWAEAVHIYKSALTCEKCAAESMVIPGEIGRCSDHSWWLSADEELVAKVHTKLREEQDSWAPAVLRFALAPLAGLASGDPMDGKPLPLTTCNILIHALKFELKNITRADEMRVSAIMKKASYQRLRRGADATWELKNPQAPTP